MAEEESELELNRFEEEIQNLFISSAGDVPAHQSKSYCAKFCELVEAHTSKWQLPLPQLQVLRRALCSFAHGAAYFPSDCEHVQYTLSSLALSVYELLLFFGKDEFPENPLKDILDCIQDCHSYLVRYQNVYLLQVRQIIKEGGPWANPVLQGILKESEQPGEEVDRYLSSEVAQFFELRVRYLMAYERIPEAMALSKGCSQHPSIGRHTFFQQAYLTCLWKASHYNQLFEEIAEIDGKEAVELICNLENDEKDEMLLALSRGFVSQQLANGDMYYMWDLVFIWSKLHLRLKPSKQDFLEECHQLIITATNVKSIFPFMKVILSELGENGLKFCVELCIRALQTDHQNDPANKSLIYKFIAYLLPKDLEICRACALLVFFLERTVESYKTVYLLYNHPDQEYHVEASPVGNSIRFDVLQILKKDLYFDPEFWNMINLRTNCLQLMSGQLENSNSDQNEKDDLDVNDDNIGVAEDSETPETIHKPEETSHVLEEVPKNSLEPPEIMSPKTSQEVTIFTHRCRLCDKVFKGGNVRRHALAHFRSDKCMFCDKPPTNLAAAVKHFNVHIQQLKKNKPVDEVQIPSSSSGLERKEMTPQVRDSNTKKPAKESKKPKVEPLLQAIRRHVQKVNGQLKKKQKITPPAEHGPSSEVKSELQEKSEHKEHVFEKEGIVDQMPLDPKDTPEKDEESQAAGNTDSLKALEKVKTVVQTSLEEKRSSVGGETVPCPFEGCERPLFSRGVSILDHLLQEHPNDLKCFKLAFRYGEGKCAFCLRKFNSFRHYLDHMDRHKDLLRHHCPHHRCTERFRTLVQLRDHMKVHPNLVLHCCFTGCSQTFGQMMDLQRHERRHYSCNGMAILATNGEVKKKTGALQTPPEHLQQPALVARLPEPITANCADEDSSNHTGAKEKSSLGMVTGSEASSKVQKNVVNGHSGSKDGTPTKLVKEQDDPSQGAKGSKPFVRPSPCAYLDERFISMPKRRKSHNSNSNSNSHFPSAAQTSESSGASQRRHCPKCFITFASDEELQAHLTLKKCTSFFGFDSDDEGR
uniref:C2H2-type domain-containing protein n=1 Tax=Denticeps clupeoides TaxID=299321 RepID=A0AAY4BRD7_9TELE